MKNRYVLPILVLAVLLTPLIGPGVAAPTPAKAVSESPADLPFNPAEVALISRNAAIPSISTRVGASFRLRLMRFRLAFTPRTLR